jgi:hypothetical protein
MHEIVCLCPRFSDKAEALSRIEKLYCALFH